MNIEERMLSEFQTTVNALKFVTDNNLESFKKDTMGICEIQKNFVESVTGKHIVIEDWVAGFVD